MQCDLVNSRRVRPCHPPWFPACWIAEPVAFGVLDLAVGILPGPAGCCFPNFAYGLLLAGGCRFLDFAFGFLLV